MTTSRPEIVIETSEDGESWREVEFPYKPGNVDRRPRFVATSSRTGLCRRLIGQRSSPRIFSRS
jgi:hypothetical protein